ncbi:hypothetical protein SADUNF_Sadunf16G0284300 [Salix dunnii]|uniref:Aminotransferase-like plant mobile domain-containing protein n=1 Tax=Salix dunnii TaxID=1413687 RepID=A0A835JEN7_9ROSI|nr:hypothetical protein SADUNF_Sadunf16G0284300 [Salix dunnii]
MRPYADNLDNWHHSSYYREEDEQVVFDGSSSDGELHSFVICLHASEPVGLDCKDSYLPHRVAMQFGMAQDLPGEPYRSDTTDKNIRFFVPSRTFVAGVSVRYLNWRKECTQAKSQRCIRENFKARNKFREDRSFTICSDNTLKE